MSILWVLNVLCYIYSRLIFFFFTQLVLRGCKRLTSYAIQDVLNNLPELDDLDFTGTSTDTTRFFQNMKINDMLNVDGCPIVTSFADEEMGLC